LPSRSRRTTLPRRSARRVAFVALAEAQFSQALASQGSKPCGKQKLTILRWLQLPGEARRSSAASGTGKPNDGCAPVAAEAGGAVQRAPGDRLTNQAAVGQRWVVTLLLAMGVRARRRRSRRCRRVRCKRTCPPLRAGGNQYFVRIAAEAAPTRVVVIGGRARQEQRFGEQHHGEAAASQTPIADRVNVNRSKLP